MGVNEKAEVVDIRCGEAKSNERASLPARDASSEENGSLMASDGRQLGCERVERISGCCVIEERARSAGADGKAHGRGDSRMAGDWCAEASRAQDGCGGLVVPIGVRVLCWNGPKGPATSSGCAALPEDYGRLHARGRV